MSWTLVLWTSSALFVLAGGYLAVWRYLHRAPARGLRRVAGRVIGGTEATAVLEADQLGNLASGARLQLATEGGGPISLEVGGAPLRGLPGTGGRRVRELRAGDRVIVHGLDSEQGFHALRVLRSGWPWPASWMEPAAAVSALLAVVALSRTAVGELQVAENLPAGAPTMARAPAPDALRELTRRMDRFYPFAGDAPPPPGEPGRTEGFLEYIAGDPRLAEGERRRLYLQPIGAFSPGQRRGLRLGAAFLARFFCLPVAIAEPLPLSEVPDEGRRVHSEWGIPQLQSTTLIHELLRARLPRDAAGLLAVTAVDLWPGEGWNAVRGQASLVARVGIVSLYRSGFADRDAESFRLFLRRSLKLMVHEVGHMFSMRHCPLQGCVMSGQNDSDLSDRRHPLLCPECLAKLVWATRCDPVERARALARFCREQGLYEEAALFKVLGEALRGW